MKRFSWNKDTLEFFKELKNENENEFYRKVNLFIYIYLHLYYHFVIGIVTYF